jgi:hypothetical protein
VIPATSARMSFRRSAIWRSSSIDSSKVRHRGRELWLVPPDELGECAVLATALLLLIEQGQVVAIEGVEPLLPIDVLELVLSGTARKSKRSTPREFFEPVPRTTAGEPSCCSTHWRISS